MTVSGAGLADAAIREGLAVATAVARELGLPADDHRVLSARGNLLVHLAPGPVVARVATLTAWTRDDPFAWLAREVEWPASPPVDQTASLSGSAVLAGVSPGPG